MSVELSSVETQVLREFEKQTDARRTNGYLNVVLPHSVDAAWISADNVITLVHQDWLEVGMLRPRHFNRTCETFEYTTSDEGESIVRLQSGSNTTHVSVEQLERVTDVFRNKTDPLLDQAQFCSKFAHSPVQFTDPNSDLAAIVAPYVCD